MNYWVKNGALTAHAARFAKALGLTPEGNHWRSACPMCGLRDSMTLAARAALVECARNDLAALGMHEGERDEVIETTRTSLSSAMELNVAWRFEHGCV